MKIRSAPILGALVTAALVLTGCAATGTETDNTPTDLTLTVSTAPISLDPAKSNSEVIFSSLAYDSLIHVSSDGTYSPSLAESFGYVGEGNTTFELKLREGLTFADETPLDSAAVAGYLEYFRNANGPFAATMGLVESVDTPDDLTVVLNLSAPNPDIALQFSEGGMWGSVVSPAGIADPEALGSTTAGAGPYQLDTDASVAGSTYVYTPRANYYDEDKQKWEKVTVNVISDPNAALQSVISGQAQWVEGTPDQVAAAEAAGLTVAQGVPDTLLLFLEDREGVLAPALADERVRQALNYAIDRDAIAEVLGGIPAQQIIAPQRVGYSEEANSVYSYDPEMAKKLLADAGYEDGFELLALVGAFDASSSQALQIVSEQFKAVGVDVTIQSAATFGDLAAAQEGRTVPSLMLPWGATTMFSVAQQLVLPSGVVNPFKSEDPELIAKFDAGTVASGDEAYPAWEDFSLAVTEKAWFVPIAVLYAPFFGSGIDDPAGDGFIQPNPLYF